MTLARYADWLARGRSHQADGRVIDAMLCYRRALGEDPSGIDARFHLGEIAWHLGSPVEAIAAWHAASERAQDHVASWHALADAYTATGRFDEARDAARRVLALLPGEPRASALARLLDATGNGDVDDAALGSAIRLERWPLPLLVAVGLEILHRASALPRAVAAIVETVASAPVTRADEDLLRHLALALAGANLHEPARAFVDRYAQSCRALHRPTMPLLWPLRTAGRAMRIGIVTSQGDARETTAVFAEAARGIERELRCTLFVTPGHMLEPLPDVDARALPQDPETAARAIAALDLDVLVDDAGLRAPTGPLLARHVARAAWALRRGRVPVLEALVDRSIAIDGADARSQLVAALRAIDATIADMPTCALEAAELAVRWDEAVRAHQAGDHATASQAYEQLLRAQPDFVPALYLGGVSARAAGDTERARERLAAAVRLAADFTDARVALADFVATHGDAAAAVALVQDGIARDGDSAMLWRALGQARLRQREAADAVEAFAEALKRDPTHGETHYNHGVALQMARQPAEAARAYQRALAFQPDLYAAHFNLGVIFDQQGNAAGAITAFSKVLDRVPGNAAAYRALAETFLASGRIEAWFANFERFERHCPNHLALAAHALEVCAYRGDFQKLAHYLDALRSGRCSEGEPQEVLDALQQILYLLHFFDIEPELLGRMARTHDELSARLYGPPLPRRAQREAGRLRIGYLSGDFRNHVMGKMMYEALRHHDRERFDIRGYSTSGARDAWTEQWQRLFGTLHVVEGLSDDAAARRIAEDDLDVLVDLSTHTKGARPGIFARKPARLQITHVATAGTLAMSTIDFKLTDRYADVAHDPRMQIEPPLVMDGCVYPYRHVEPSATPYARKDAGIAGDAVVIGAFVTPLKLSQRCLELWREVMQRVPAAVIAFSPIHPSLRSVLARLCETVRIDRRRIVFLPQGRDDAGNQARYELVDFVLDPLPYGGVNGTLEALDMHVPVVTLVGRRHAERTSFSILTNLGVTDTVARTGGEYVDIAARLATDREFMRDVRARIAAGLRGSTLTDMQAHAANLEDAYVAALAARVPEVLGDAGVRASTGHAAPTPMSHVRPSDTVADGDKTARRG